MLISNYLESKKLGLAFDFEIIINFAVSTPLGGKAYFALLMAA